MAERNTLEHVPDLEGAIEDLRRLARCRLILVVPREREYRYPLNLDFNCHSEATARR